MLASGVTIEAHQDHVDSDFDRDKLSVETILYVSGHLDGDVLSGAWNRNISS